jgi:uncharacterized repeat protein (TIGR03943 family)
MTTPASPSQARPINTVALAEVLLLGGMGALLLIKWLRDQLIFYIHPRYTALMIVAAVVLLLMAAARLRAIYGDRPSPVPGWSYLLLAVPLLFGTLVPAQPLGAGALAGRGLDSASAASGRNASLDADPAQWDLLEWATALSIRGEELDGTPIDVEGFVYPDAALGADGFFVVRYVLTCCAADGAGVGLPVIWEGGGALVADSWVRVRGQIVTTEIGGTRQAAVQASAIEPIDQPANPYLYP